MPFGPEISDQVRELTDAPLPEYQELKTPPARARYFAEILLSAIEDGASSSWEKVSRTLGLVELLHDSALCAAVLNASRVDERVTALHLLLSKGAPLGLIQRALDLGADPSLKMPLLKSPHGEFSQAAPLLIAALAEDEPAFLEVLARSTDLDARDGRGHTISHCLVESQLNREHLLKFIRALVEKGADLDQIDSFSHTVLSTALLQSDWELARELIALGASLEKLGGAELSSVTLHLGRMLVVASESGERAHCSLILSVLEGLRGQLPQEALRAIVNSRRGETGPTVLHYLAFAPALAEIIPMAAQLGAEVNSHAELELEIGVQHEIRKKVTPLHMAVLGGSTAGVSNLLAGSANPRSPDSKGESPLFMLAIASPDIATNLIVDSLVKSGAQPNDLNVEGLSCSTVCVRILRWAAVRELSCHGAEAIGLTEDDVERLRVRLPTHINGLITGRRWEKVSDLLHAVCLTIEPRHEGFLARLLNTSVSEKDQATVFLSLCRSGAPARLVRDALEFGASIEARIPFDIEGSIKDVEKQHYRLLFKGESTSREGGVVRTNALHLAARYGSVDTCAALIDLGLKVNEPDAYGYTALHYAMYRPQTMQRQEMLQLLLSRGADIDALSDSREDAISLAFHRLAASAVADLMDAIDGVRVTQNQDLFRQFPRPQEYLTAFKRLVEYQRHGDWIASIAEEVFLTARDPEVAVLVHEALREATKMPFPSDGWKLTKVMPYLLTLHSRELLAPLVYAVEYNLGSGLSGNGIGYHPNETELMALLNHPRDIRRRSEFIDRLTSALTSINRLIAVHYQASDLSASNWGHIGTFALSFSRWREDASTVSYRDRTGSRVELHPSLFSCFGLSATPASANDAIYGTGFDLLPGSKSFSYWAVEDRRKVRREFDNECYISLRRGYIVVSSPEGGTLLIRNSSPRFGRNLLKFTAYWSPRSLGKSLSLDDLNNFGFENSGRLAGLQFCPILSRKLYSDYYDADERIGICVQRLRTFFHAYGAYKFDTRFDEAWHVERGIGTVLVGGHLSDGFKEVVNRLKAQLTLHEMFPGQFHVSDLAFMHRDLTPWSTFGFTANGRQTPRLHVNRDVVSVMEKMSMGDFTESELKRTNLRRFLQEAGLSKGGELIFIRGD